MIKNMVVIVAVVLFSQLAAQCDVIISDDFNRADSTDLGATSQGYNWVRYETANLTPVIYNDALYFNSSGTHIYLDSNVPSVKDFVADFNYKWGRSYAEAGRYFKLNFRNTSNGNYLEKGGTQSGYELQVDIYSNTQLRVQIYSEYGGTLGVGYVTYANLDSTLAAHDITLKAVDNIFNVYVDDTLMENDPALTVTDMSANPGANSNGYFALNMNAYRNCTIDNFVVSSIPEPGTAMLLSVGAILGFTRKRLRNS